MTTLTDRSLRSIHSSLVEFGYPVTLDEVREAVRKVLAGESVEGDIIAMFVRSMLREAGVVA